MNGRVGYIWIIKTYQRKLVKKQIKLLRSFQNHIVSTIKNPKKTKQTLLGNKSSFVFDYADGLSYLCRKIKLNSSE